MGTKLTYDQKGHLSDRSAELYRVTSNGTRDYGKVMQMIQDAIEGKFPEMVVPSISWRPVEQIADKFLEWNRHFGWGLSSEQLSAIVQLPDHAGPLQSTSVSLTFNKGLQFDRQVVQQVIRYEMATLGKSYTDYLEEATVAYYPGNEPIKGKGAQLSVDLLDVGKHWNPNKGIVPREVRAQYQGQRLPGLEVDWAGRLERRDVHHDRLRRSPGLRCSWLGRRLRRPAVLRPGLRRGVCRWLLV